MTTEWALYVVTDEYLSRGRSHVEVAEEAIRGGADVIQLRDKERSSRELLEIAKEIKRITATTGTRFIVNDRLDLALLAADGVHLGQSDLPVEAARRLAKRPFIIGASVGSVEEALRAEREGADYVAVSPVFTTGSKGDAGPGLGLGMVRSVRAAVEIPVLAIGGINQENAPEVVGAGADGCAVISSVVSAPQIAPAARVLRETIVRALIERRGRSS
ncbi:MAG TPA: thiamine phosphate synthase [Methanoregulaceae archaeon]|nr:thiamine phosphate synthase [Methanoregulaceae archaeon]